MRTRARHAIIRQIHHDLDTLTNRGPDGPLLDHAVHKLLEYRARGYPTTSGQVGSIGGTGTSDPIGRIVTDQTPDQFDRALKDLDVQLSIVARSLTRTLAIARAATAAATYRDDDAAPQTIIWCSSCSRTRDSLGRTNLSPAHVNTHEMPGIDDGPLCRWCYDFARQHHVLPPITILEAHRDGRRITQQMIDTARAS